MKKQKLLLILIVLLIWTLAVVVHGYISISAGLRAASDGYDANIQFQLIAFVLTKFPYYLIGLVLLLIALPGFLILVRSKSPP
jgi:uncharacterized membrane protein